MIPLRAMRTRDFHYELPDELIAQHPAAERTSSRLLVVDRLRGELADTQFSCLDDYLQPGDCLVFNNTRVIPARLYGQKQTGGKLEVLIERLLDEQHALAHIRSSKSPKAGSTILIAASDGTQQYRVNIDGRQGALFEISAIDVDLSNLIENCGHMPLPPYITRDDNAQDNERYQTVYAEKPGAVAAPTAGLHFDDALLTNIREKGINTAFVTLHVGAGTFQPVRVDDIREHQMHSEYLQVPEQTVQLCKRTRQQGGRIIAVGTTSVRCLETASQSGELQAYQGETDIFIYPGYSFKSVDALLTNFHLPESTLIMLVSAFAGYDQTMAAYQHAVAQQYRFFSYGDAMLIV